MGYFIFGMDSIGTKEKASACDTWVMKRVSGVCKLVLAILPFVNVSVASSLSFF